MARITESKIRPCLIWGTQYAAEVREDFDTGMCLVNSPRAGLEYKVSGDICAFGNLMYDNEKARLTTWLIDQGLQGVKVPEITEGVIKYVRAKRSLSVHERADRLLSFIAKQSKMVGDTVNIIPQVCDEACAWSESITEKEIRFLLNYLDEKGSLKENCPINAANSDEIEVQITVDGYSRIADRAANVISSQAFVAMWFDKSTTQAYEKGIRPAIEDAGYKPMRIDQKEHVNKIEDEIIAEIRRSRFLVADFTEGCGGTRGSVYYEAGFARGLGLPVVFTCRKDSLSKLHFDTSHYNHVVWSNPEDLRKKLRARIRAELGDGPELSRP